MGVMDAGGVGGLSGPATSVHEHRGFFSDGSHISRIVHARNLCRDAFDETLAGIWF